MSNSNEKSALQMSLDSLVCTDISKWYGEAQVLNNVNFTLAANEIELTPVFERFKIPALH